MFKTIKDSIQITIPDDLIEAKIPDIEHKIKNYSIKQKIKDKKIQCINFDLDKVAKIDFFGFQYFLSFYHYLEKEYEKIELKIIKKSSQFSKFENKIGYKIKNQEKK